MYYIIDDKLEKSTYEECLKRNRIYVATVSAEEFKKNSELFNMGIDMDFDPIGKILLPSITSVSARL